MPPRVKEVPPQWRGTLSSVTPPFVGRGVDYRGRALFAVALVALAACASRPPVVAVRQPATSVHGEAEPPNAADNVAEAEDEMTEAEAGGGGGAGPCPLDMALVTTEAPVALRFCIDKYEASLVEVLPDGTEQPFAHYMPVDGHDVRAVSAPHVFPQGYISEVQAQEACAASSKYLCKPEEWKTACGGPAHTTFPYGNTRRPGACHDTGRSPVLAVFGAKAVAASGPYSPFANTTHTKAASRAPRSTKGRAAHASRPHGKPRGTAARSPTRGRTVLIKGAPRPTTKGGRRPAKKSVRPASVDPGVWARLNDPGLGQVEGALSRTGEHPDCVNEFGVFDMVGNLHEWVGTEPASAHGTFAGGYYLDTTINGEGCSYRTQAHAHDYHDYSTGFRCCAEAE